MKETAPIPRLHEHRLGDSVMLSGTAVMNHTAGSPHVRHIEFRCLRLAPDPVVNATVFAPKSPGEAFVVYQVKVNDLGNETQITVHARHVENKPSDLHYHCHVIAVGKPARRRGSASCG